MDVLTEVQIAVRNKHAISSVDTSSVRGGLCKVVQFFALDETSAQETAEWIVKLVTEDEPGINADIYIKEDTDAEIGMPYFIGVVLFDFFLDRWESLGDFDPKTIHGIVELSRIG